MNLIQFAAIVLMTGLTLKLAVLPKRAEVNSVTARSRWLMFSGVALLDLQFGLQLTLGLRQMGVTQAVMLNLIMFTMVSWLLSLSVLALLKQGEISPTERWLGAAVWLAEIILITVTTRNDGQPLLADTPQLRLAELVGSLLYFAMQLYYNTKQIVHLRRMRLSLANYYDDDMSHMLRWMQVSIANLALLALFVPAIIFVPGKWLMPFSVVFLYGIWYFVDSFCNYAMSSMPRKVKEARRNEESVGGSGDAPEMSTEQQQRAETAIGRWTSAGGHLRSGLKMPAVAEQAGVPYYLLALWLRQQNMKFNDWMTSLRVDEAKRTILQHPEWTNEAIANHCGFTDRTAFQRKFKEKTGQTPAQFLDAFRITTESSS